eukprot:scaffold29208_cov118-Phaeocystis_antarctica.AAC.1
MRKRSYGQTGPCADAFSTGLGERGQGVVPTPVVSGDTHCPPPPRAPMIYCAHAEFTRAIKCHCGAHRGEIHVRCNEPAVHQAKQARRHVLGPNRRGCMWITPCAALNGAFRARCFFLRPMHQSQYSSGWHAVAGTSFAGEKMGFMSTLLSFPIVALWPTDRGALLNADGCIPSRWARYWRLPTLAGLFTALAWRCAVAAPGRVGSPADRMRVTGSCNAGNCSGGVALHGSALELFAAASEWRGAAPCTTVLSMASALSFNALGATRARRPLRGAHGCCAGLPAPGVGCGQRRRHVPCERNGWWSSIPSGGLLRVRPSL